MFDFPILYEKKAYMTFEILTMVGKTLFLFIFSRHILPYNLPEELNDEGRRRKEEEGVEGKL